MLDLSKNTKATKKDLIAYIQKEKGSKGFIYEKRRITQICTKGTKTK